MSNYNTFSAGVYQLTFDIFIENKIETVTINVVMFLTKGTYMPPTILNLPHPYINDYKENSTHGT